MITLYTIRLTDPNQPARVYQADSTKLGRVYSEAKILGKGVLIGGTVEIFKGAPAGVADADPLARWVVR